MYRPTLFDITKRIAFLLFLVFIVYLFLGIPAIFYGN